MQSTRSTDAKAARLAMGVAAVFVCMGLGGCAVGRELDTGAGMVGITTADVNAGVATAGQWFGSLSGLLAVGGPAAGAVGLLGWLLQRRAGAKADAAWDEATAAAERRILLGQAVRESKDV